MIHTYYAKKYRPVMVADRGMTANSAGHIEKVFELAE
jgi:hypothetical protein